MSGNSAAAATAAPTISIFAGNGTETLPTPGPATHSTIGDVEFGMAFDSSGNAYVADDHEDYVYKVTPGGILSIFAGNGTRTTPTPGPATHSSIGDPEGLAFDRAGNLYIADDHNDYVYKVTPGGTLSIFAGNGSTGTVSTGPARSEPIGRLDGVAVDRLGDVYIVSYGNNQVYKVNPGGSLSVFAGIAGNNSSPTAGVATHSPVGFPEGVATDNAGDVYVTDDRNNYVVKITPAGILSIFAGNGTRHLPTPGQAANRTAVGDPEYVAVSGAGNLFLTDDANNRVYEITPSEQISILAGTGPQTKAVPGRAASSPVGQPEAIAVNPSNQVIVSDDDNKYVYKIDTNVPSDGGYLVAATDGGIFPFGDAHLAGSLGNVHLNAPIVGMAMDPVTGGYWLVASDGGVFNFNAPFYGSTGNVHLNQPIVGVASTSDGRGYYLVARDGGVFPFGPGAMLQGSLGNVHLNAPIVGMATDPVTGGYWLVASDGGVFNFNAPFAGSTGGVHLNKPIVALAATPNSQGYWLIASDGGVFPFNARFYGSTGGVHLNQPIIGGAPTPDGLGYVLVAADGGIFPFGAAVSHGSLGSVHLNKPATAFAVTP